MEAPGSLTFEVPDIPRIVDVARKHGIITVLDNTWSAGVYLKPLSLGVDLSVQSLTKYIIGHADAFGGAVMTGSPQMDEHVSQTAADLGLALGPDDAYFAQRGIRTLATRLQAQSASALKVADWLEKQPWVNKVVHPAFTSHPDHERWKTSFSGASGLFGLYLTPCSDEDLTAALKRLRIFGFGFSWGGFESLLIPCDEQLKRSVKSDPRPAGHLLRLSIGLEDPDDLIEDLDHAFAGR